MCRLVNTMMLAIIDQNADILPIGNNANVYINNLSVGVSGKVLRWKVDKIHLFLKAVRHSSSSTRLGRRLKVLSSGTCDDLEIDELCSFYGDYDEKLVLRGPLVWQKLINEWFYSKSQKEIRKGGLAKLVEYCSLYRVTIGRKDNKDIKLNLFINSICLQFYKSLLATMLTRKDIRNSEFCCKYCGSAKHEGKNCILHPDSEQELNFRSLPDDFYGFIKGSISAGTIENIGYEEEE
uniref:Uncharacterized protein n=1 Tax=Ditylenchus dipsaci TaxID=166011 RepID=A0A915E936_9BILA